MMHKILLSVLMSCMIISCASLKKPETEEELKLAEFDKFIKDIENEYAYLDTRIDEVNCIKETYRNEAIHLSNVNEHVLFYETILMELWDSHVQLNTNVKDSYRVDYTIYSEFEDNFTKVKNIWQTQLNPLPKENIIDAELISFNGTPFQYMIDSFPTICHDKQNPEVRTWIGNKILSGKRTEPRVVTLKLSSGDTITIDIDALKVVEEKSNLSYKRIGNIAYIRINNSLGEQGLVEDFNLALNTLMNTEALILDLRNTEAGGNTGVAKPIIGRFISEKKATQLYENKKEKYFGYVKPTGTTYTKPVYVLVNRWTASMGEGMAIAFDGMNRAQIIGTEMNGLRGGMRGFKFLTKDYSYVLSFEKIFHIEGTPREDFVPDVYVRQTQLNEDEIFNKALEMIKSKGVQR